jgi:tRNA A-37 threonylcarbamoyl transferase component Bud32
MSAEAAPGAVAEALEQAFADLAANVPAEDIAGRLRALEASCQAGTAARAKLLHARGLALNRLGFPSEALGDLLEAGELFERLADHSGAAWVRRSIALVHSWRGDGREASLALLRGIAEDSEDHLNLALAFFEAGRIESEIGRPRDAHRFFARGLDIGAAALPALEIRRARINMLQALVAVGDLAAAERTLAALDLAGATDRLRHLAMLERARLAARKGRIEDAGAILRGARALVPADPDNFSHVERWHVEAEVLFAGKHFDEALGLVAKAIARYAADDLPGREAGARILESEILDSLGRGEAADRTLAAALRRVAARGLTGHADAVRARLAARGRAQGAWLPGLDPAPANAGSDGRFVRRRPLGAGGFGSVSRAYDLEFGGEVALKRLCLGNVYDSSIHENRLDTARMEVAAASRIQHPGVGRVFGLLIEPDGDALLVRELVEGPTLREAMKGKLHFAEKLGLLAQLAHCLAAVHAAAIVHRDLKPENIVLRGGNSPVIIDFGISAIGAGRQPEDAPKTRNYAAPEQLAGGFVDARSDLYSFGVIACEVFLGKLPPPPDRGLRGLLADRRRRGTIAGDLCTASVPGSLAVRLAGLLSASPRRRAASALDTALAIQAAMEGSARV